MYSIRVNDEYFPQFPLLWETYESSFPASERRLMRAQREVFGHPRYRLDAWFDGDDSPVGLMDWWEYEGFRYVEHIAVAPQARSGGYGSKILKRWMEQSEKPVFLEIDPVNDDISQRRLNFYERLGFVQNPMEHFQPHFQGTGETVPLRVLSHPTAITDADYAAFYAALRKDVWADIRPQGGRYNVTPELS